METNTITIEDIDPRRYFEYADGCLSMSFEGAFYSIMNNDSSYKLEEEFSAILLKYGLYYELGNAWNLSCFDC